MMMNIIDSLEGKMLRGIQENMDRYLKETGQSEKITTEFGQGVAFISGALTATVMQVFEENRKWMKDNNQLR